MELKPVIIAKDGVAKIGNDIITLTDQSTNTYSTTCVKSFIAYVLRYFTIFADRLLQLGIFFTISKIELRELIAKKTQKPIAECSLDPHVVLVKAMKMRNKELSINELDEFLYEMRAFYCGVDAMDLYDKLQNLQVKKVTTIKREKDRQGNFLYACEMKDTEGSREFPASITFNVPLFDHLDENIEILFDLHIKYSEGKDDKGPTMTFCLKNPLLDEQVNEKAKDIVTELLQEITGVDKYYGHLVTFEQTDGWMYRENKVG